MQSLKQFLLVCMNALVIVLKNAIPLILFFVPSILCYFVGFGNLAFASMLFLVCALARPSVELKNRYYLQQLLVQASLLITINFFAFQLFSVLTSSQFLNLPFIPVINEQVMCIVGFVFASVLLPFLLCINLFVLDSGMRLHRLFYVIGIFRLYARVALIAVPVTFIGILLKNFAGSFIFLMILLPVITTLTALLYYKSLYEEFGKYYAEF